MTSGKLTANLFSLEISTDGGTTYSALALGRGFTLNFDSKEIDMTNMDSAGWDEFIQGNKNWSGSFNGLMQFEAVAGKELPENLLTHWLSGVLVKFNFTTGETGDNQYTGDAFVKGGSIDFQEGQNVPASFDLRGTGELERAAVPA